MDLQKLFDKFENELILLNVFNNLIKIDNSIIKIFININYDFNEYDSSVYQTYYFFDNWCFKNISNKVFIANINDIFFIHENFHDSKEYKEYSKEYQEKYSSTPTTEKILTYIQNHELIDNTDTICDYSEGNIILNSSLSSSGDFEIKALNILGINNNEQKINYHGSFYAENLGMYHSDSFYCHLELVCSNDSLPFYKELLLEAYSLLLEKNYKLAFFTAFSAFENFCNIKSNSESEKSRLSEKLKIAFENTSPPLTGEESYRQLKINLTRFETLRNQIAHGNQNGNWCQTNAKSNAIQMYIYTSVTILCHEEGFINFKQISKRVPKRK